MGTMDLSRDYNHECDIVEDESLIKQYEHGNNTAAI